MISDGISLSLVTRLCVLVGLRKHILGEGSKSVFDFFIFFYFYFFDSHQINFNAMLMKYLSIYSS